MSFPGDPIVISGTAPEDCFCIWVWDALGPLPGGFPFPFDQPVVNFTSLSNLGPVLNCAGPDPAWPSAQLGIFQVVHGNPIPTPPAGVTMSFFAGFPSPGTSSFVETVSVAWDAFWSGTTAPPPAAAGCTSLGASTLESTDSGRSYIGHAAGNPCIELDVSWVDGVLSWHISVSTMLDQPTTSTTSATNSEAELAAAIPPTWTGEIQAGLRSQIMTQTVQFTLPGLPAPLARDWVGWLVGVRS